MRTFFSCLLLSLYVGVDAAAQVPAKGVKVVRTVVFGNDAGTQSYGQGHVQSNSNFLDVNWVASIDGTYHWDEKKGGYHSTQSLRNQTIYFYKCGNQWTYKVYDVDTGTVVLEGKTMSPNDLAEYAVTLPSPLREIMLALAELYS